MSTERTCANCGAVQPSSMAVCPTCGFRHAATASNPAPADPAATSPARDSVPFAFTSATAPLGGPQAVSPRPARVPAVLLAIAGLAHALVPVSYWTDSSVEDRVNFLVLFDALRFVITQHTDYVEFGGWPLTVISFIRYFLIFVLPLLAVLGGLLNLGRKPRRLLFALPLAVSLAATVAEVLRYLVWPERPSPLAWFGFQPFEWKYPSSILFLPLAIALFAAIGLALSRNPRTAGALPAGVGIAPFASGERAGQATSFTAGTPTWRVHLPGQPAAEVDTDTLRLWASARMLMPQTLIEDAASGRSYPAEQIPGVYSPKSYTTALLLSFFLGYLGIDRFYLGHTGLGVVKLLTAGGCGIWAFVDFILIAMRKVNDSENLPLA